MRHLTLILAGLLVISGIVCTNLWLELRTERQSSADLQDQTPEGPGRASPMNSVVASSAPAGDAMQATACFPDTPQDSQPTEQFMARMESLISRIPPAISGIPEEKYLLRDPEYRKARLAQMRISESNLHPGLADALGLAESEANQLFELMAASLLNTISEIELSTSGKISPAALGDTLKRQGADQEESVHKFLGSTRYAQLREYRQDIQPALLQVTNIGNLMYSNGQSLTDSQTRALRTAMLDEQRRQLQREQAARLQTNAGAEPSTTFAQNLADSATRKEQRNRGILEAAAPHLNAAQLAVLRKDLDKQTASSRRAMEMSTGK